MKIFNKNLLAIMLAAGTVGTAAAQQLGKGTQKLEVAYSKNGSDWVKFKDTQFLNPETFAKEYKSYLGLGANDELVLQRTETDKMGMTHYRYQQYHKGVRVSGAEYIVHAAAGRVVSCNGRLVKGLNNLSMPSITADDAISAALEKVGAQKYMWESAYNERMIKRSKHSDAATYYPQPELVMYSQNHNRLASEYRLAYKMEVQAELPVSRQDIFVDASTGEVIRLINKLHFASGTAETKYSGTKNIVTEEVTPTEFILRDNTRGGGVETYNLETGTDYGTAVDFTDSDNFWNNVNAAQDEVATDAHWGAETTYDYFFGVHGRQSFDDMDAPLLSYVHYDVGFVNAFWDGTRMTYGDGDGDTYFPLTTLDICGHEVSHGVTEFSAGLVYQDEPGALNESFSDIFGAAIDFYGNPSLANWLIGEQINAASDPIRSMEDPNAKDNPDTYHGDFWEFDPFVDNGGVHINSGVQNYWFYLLCEGGSGTNDNGDPYNVTAIGMSDAEQIAYRNLTAYLTTESQFADAREGSLMSAVDLFGPCSPQYYQVANAWYAVGVGNPVLEGDLMLTSIVSPETACGLTDSEQIIVTLKNNGCTTDFAAGTNILMSYSLDGGAAVNELLTLAAPMSPGSEMTYTFTTTADLTTLGMHSLDVWGSVLGDPLTNNDTISNYEFESLLQQNTDLGVVAVTAPVSQCDLSTEEHIVVEIGFWGCDLLPAGSTVPVQFTVNGGTPVVENITTTADVFPGETFGYTFTTGVDMSADGDYIINAQTNMPDDPDNTNDAVTGYDLNNQLTMPASGIDFEETTDMDLVGLNIREFASGRMKSFVGKDDSDGFEFTGSETADPGSLGSLEFPTTDSEVWSLNEGLLGEMRICVDATTWSTCILNFDMRQTYTNAYAFFLGTDYPMASSARVMVEGTQISDTYHPATYVDDEYVTYEFNLNAYAGTKFEIVFQAKNIASAAALSGFPVTGSDRVLLDNIFISRYGVSGMSNKETLSAVVFPNPSKGNFNLNFVSAKAGKGKVTVCDVTGKVVYEGDLNVNGGANKTQLDLSSLSKGVYVLNLSTETAQFSQRIVKE